MPWRLLEIEKPTRKELHSTSGKAKFYADHNLDESVVHVLQRLKYDVETARDVGAEAQPDTFHYKRGFRNRRVLVTHDKDYLDNSQFPLSQTAGVVILDVDTTKTEQLARAPEVVDTILGGLAPVLMGMKVVVHSDYTITFTQRVPDGKGTGFVEDRRRWRFDENGEDIWEWEDALPAR